MPKEEKVELEDEVVGAPPNADRSPSSRRELELIDALETVLKCDSPAVVRWLGDDAAVVRARGYAVTSVDTVVDGVPFRSGQLSPAEIGHRALATALSDIAAMGADPGEAYLALGVPTGFDRAQLVELAGGAQ